MAQRIAASLRLKLSIAFLAMALVPLSLIAWRNYGATQSALTQAAYLALHAVASQTAVRLDAFVQANANVIGTEARVPALTEYLALPEGDPRKSAAREQALDVLQAFTQKDAVFISSYALLDLKGRNVLDTHAAGIGADESASESFQVALETGLPYASPIQLPPQADGAAYLNFSSLVSTPAGQPVGVLRGRYSATVLQRMVAEATGLVGPQSFAMLLTDQHLILAHGQLSPSLVADRLYRLASDLSTGLNRASGPEPYFTVRLRDDGNGMQAAAVTRMGMQPWLVVFLQPQDVFLAPVRAQTRETLVLAAGVLAVVVVAAIAMAQLLTRPIVRLTWAARRFAEGDLDSRAATTSHDEIGELAETFNFMTQKLKLTLEGLRRSETNYRGIFENAVEGIYQVSMEGRMISANPAIAQLLGYASPEDLVRGGVDVRDQLYVHPDEREAFLRDILEHGLVVGRPFEFYRKDRRRIWVAVSARVVRDDAGVPLFIEGFMTDTTARTHAEEELKRHRDHLDELVRERTAELVVAKERAEVASKAKSAFLASMSHELRTPLNAVLGYAQILLRQGKHMSRQEAVGLSTIQQSGEQLLSLITDILDLSKVEAGKLDLYPEVVNLSEFLGGVADIVRVKAVEKNLEFMLDIATNLPHTVLLAEGRVRQILLNLLSNAVKFTDRGWVNLCVRGSPVGAGVTRLHFEVKDTGIGIAAEQLDTIFQPFDQVSDPEHRVGGTGLGLTISRQLVRLMGSDIEVESRPGQGSCFRFDLDVPALDVQAEATTFERPVVGYEGPRKRILVVDDVAANRGVIIDLLSSLGFQMTSADNGRQGVDKAIAQLPDLILMDILMPVMDGLQATHHLRQSPGFETLPIIVLSAGASDADKDISLRVGANGFLTKPVDFKQMLKQIGNLLELTWIHEPVGEQRLAANEPIGPLLAPPAQELEVLYRLAKIGNMRSIAEHADHLAGLGDQYRAFAARLHLLAERFQSRAIVELVAQYRDKIADEVEDKGAAP